MRYFYISITFLFCFFNVFSVGSDKYKISGNTVFKPDLDENFFKEKLPKTQELKDDKSNPDHKANGVVDNFYQFDDSCKDDESKGSGVIHQFSSHYRSKSFPESKLSQENIIQSINYLMQCAEHFSEWEGKTLAAVKGCLKNAKEREDAVLNGCVSEELKIEGLKTMIQNQETCITCLSNALKKERQRREGLEKDFNTFKLCVNNQFGKLSPIFKAMQLNQNIPGCLIPKKIIKKIPKE